MRGFGMGFGRPYGARLRNIAAFPGRRYAPAWAIFGPPSGRVHSAGCEDDVRSRFPNQNKSGIALNAMRVGAAL
jgi:hypothetical protein